VHSTNYIIRFVFILTAIVAVVLALMSTGLKPIHEKNEALYNKRAILEAVSSEMDSDLASLSNDDIQKVFNDQIEQIVINAKGEKLDAATIEARGYKGGKAENVDMGKEIKMDAADRVSPLYVYTKSSGDKLYIVSVRGKGLWDEIWGNIALKSDLKTIAGVSFDHKGETPGLGAEIKDNAGWKKQFIGKTIYNPDGEFTSVGVIKGGAKNKAYEVDGISGATITADGVDKMLKLGLRAYEPYLKTLNK
jgi:Na+-transporting NADH:ubiquinone oxidoreductase subunit C